MEKYLLKMVPFSPFAVATAPRIWKNVMVVTAGLNEFREMKWPSRWPGHLSTRYYLARIGRDIHTHRADCSSVHHKHASEMKL